MTSPGERLRQLLSGDAILAVPGCHDALGALLIEEAGFPLVYMSGFSVAASHGIPDIGILTMTDMVRQAEGIARATSLPVLVDADTGYGGVANIAETVRAFERAGVAGLHLEDQKLPKKCGAMAGKELVSDQEMAARLRTALKARRSPDFLIVGRTDAVTLHGIEEAARRCKAMEAAGAEAVMVPSLASVEDIAAIRSAVSVPVLHTVAETVRPVLDLPTLEAAGVDMAIYPLSLVQILVKAQRELLRELKERGTTLDRVPAMASFAEVNRLVGTERHAAFETAINSGED